MSAAPSLSFLLVVALSTHRWVSVVQGFSALPFSTSSRSRCSSSAPSARNENAPLLFSSAWAPYLMDQPHLVQDEEDPEGRQAAAAAMSSPEQQHEFAASWFESSTNGPPPSSMPMVDVDVSNRYFQLEEMEDAERRMTGLWLLPDGSIGTEHASLQEVEGGLLQGHWYYRPTTEDNEHDDELEMILTRTFPAGRTAVRPSDMGEFEYSIQRIYRGRLTAVGEHVAVEGSIWVPANQVPGGGDGESNMLQVGYFSMIDTQFQEHPPADIPLPPQESVAMPPPQDDSMAATAASMMPQDASAWDLQPAFVGGPIC